MSFPQKVKSVLWGIVDDMACNLSSFVQKPGIYFSREQKLGFAQLIRFCICMESGCINHELLKYFFFNPDKVPTASASIQQRTKLLPQAFRYLLEQFNLHFPIRLFMGKYSLIAVDGSEFNIARNPAGISTFHPSNGKSKRGFNRFHTISFFNLILKRYLDVVVQPGRGKNKSAALCQLIDQYSYNGCPFRAADRGFASYNVFAHALENGFYFSSRAKDINPKRLLAARHSA